MTLQEAVQTIQAIAAAVPEGDVFKPLADALAVIAAKVQELDTV